MGFDSWVQSLYALQSGRDQAVTTVLQVRDGDLGNWS